MNIAILSKLQDGTGNKTTAERISSYLEDDFTVTLLDCFQFQKPSDINVYIEKHDIKAILGIHLIHAGKLLIDCVVPYVIVFGGTDLNISVKSNKEIDLMTKVVSNAKILVSFNEEMKLTALKAWPYLELSKIRVQPQGVKTSCSKNIDYDFQDLFSDYKVICDTDIKEKNIFLMVGGIRPVKDILYLANIINEWNSHDSSICMVVIGPELDESYAKTCKTVFKRTKCIYLFTTLPVMQIGSLMKYSVALVNSSVNEGMAGAILEALSLKVPVIARRNHGNLSIINDGENGLLYDSPEEFKQKAAVLLGNDEMKANLVKNGYSYTKRKHDDEKEKSTYISVLSETLCN